MKTRLSVTRKPRLGYQPNLGLATTRELLEEIRVRGEVEPVFIKYGNIMSDAACSLVESLPRSVLNYRTVDF